MNHNKKGIYVSQSAQATFSRVGLCKHRALSRVMLLKQRRENQKVKVHALRFAHVTAVQFTIHVGEH